MPKLPSFIALALCTGAAFAQSTQPGQTTPSVTPSDTPAVTPSQTPSVIPQSQPPAIVVAPAAGGMSQCQNMIGAERDKCLQEEKKPAAAGPTGTPPAGTPATGTPSPQNTAPAAPAR